MAVDYKSFGPNGPGNSQGTKFNRFWWTSKDDTELAQSIENVIMTINEFDGKRQTQYQISSRLYGNCDIMGVNGLSYAKVVNQPNSLKDRISYNVVQSAIDTITAKIAKNRPKPLFLTSGGDYKLQRRAKKLTKFIDGVFYDNKMNEKGPSSFRKACVWGDGLIHAYAEDGKVKFEEVLNREIFVDWLDGMMGKPRQMHRIKSIDRAVLEDRFPESKAAIRQAKETATDLTGSYQHISDQILVRESWHLPSGPEATDGLHVITISDHVLFKEQYNKHRFPFARMPWSTRLEGFWAQGLAEQIQNIQLEINKLLWVIQRSMHLAGTFKIFIENSSKIVKEHLSNDIGAIIAYTGQQPTYLTPPIVPAEIYNHLFTLKNAAFEQAGVSQLSAASQKPAGLNSGKALREYNDIESERFMTIGHQYENFHLDLADLSIMVGKDIYKEDSDFQINVPGKKFIETISWKEVDLEQDQYIMKCFPISSLPSDPEGRLQTVQEYVQAGFYSQRVAKKLLNFPDLEAEDDLEGAMEDHITKVLDNIVEEGDYQPPEPDDDLDLSKQLVLEYIAQGKRDCLESDKLELLRTYNDQIESLKTKAVMAMQPPMGAPGMPGAAAQAVPTAPPVSDMLPNIPQSI
jgi:hypothetical protein